MHRHHFDNLRIYQAGLAAVDPEQAVLDALEELDPDWSGRSLWLLAIGKAAPAMARAAVGRLDHQIVGGLVLTRRGQAQAVGCPRLAVYEGGHPIPDGGSLEATRALLELVRRIDPEDRVLILLSGGGSALLEDPVDGLTLDDLVQTTEQLLRSGASIDEVNTVRKQLSRVKGGRLAEALPAPSLTMILSDVLGSDPSTVASGPTVADPTTPEQARAVLCRHGLQARVPAAVWHHLERAPAPPPPDHPALERANWQVVADNQRMVEAACEAARDLGYRCLIVTTSLQGEAREVGRVIAAMAREIRSYGRPVPAPVILLLSGETTVRVTGVGRGGRCQELALSFALEVDGLPGVQLLSGSSDGHDGPTDAAGALVDGQTCERARALGLDPRDYLDRNDSYGFFTDLGECWHTGPSGTNTNDLLIVRVE